MKPGSMHRTLSVVRAMPSRLLTRVSLITYLLVLRILLNLKGTCCQVQGLSQRGSARLIVYAAEGNGSCCGGRGGSGSGKESCSSHESKAPPPGVAGVGAEFENMVSRSTMQEFEKEYDTGEVRTCRPSPYMVLEVRVRV